MKRTVPKIQGVLITNGVVLEKHEYTTINVLLEENDVELVRKSRTPHTTSPDIFMRGMLWEIKSPTGKTLRSIDRIAHRAVHQARNIIIDLRRTKIPDDTLIPYLEKMFYKMRSIRNFWIIAKGTKIIKCKK